MKNRDWIILVVILVLAVVLIQTRPSFKEYIIDNNTKVLAEPEYEVVKIFEHEGCTGYKFNTKGSYYREHFFVKCGSEVLTTSMKSCGKSQCPEEISTHQTDKADK